MKKFRIIRNILIILIILVAAIYICWMRSNKIKTSKAYKVFEEMGVNNHLNEKRKITMQTSCNTDKVKCIFIEATDEEKQQEIFYSSNQNQEQKPEEEGSGTISLTTKERITGYCIFPKIKKWKTIYSNEEETSDYDKWIVRYEEQLLDCKYYTKGFEFINGKLLYFEKFKEAGLKFYFDKEKLVYMKNSNIDESFGNNVKDILYNVKITYDDSYKKYTEIPEDYTEYTVNEKGEMIDIEKSQDK